MHDGAILNRKKMLNLYDKLYLNAKQALEENKKVWPHAEGVEKLLKTKCFWHELTIREVRLVVSMVDYPGGLLDHLTWAFGDNIIQEVEI